jgi:hypothetical protein
MKLLWINPSFVSFLSGLAAAAAVNLVTAIVGSDGSLHSSIKLILASTPWLLMGVALWRASALLESAARQVDLARTPVLTAIEVEELTADSYGKVKRPVLVAFAVSGILALGGVLMIVLLFGSSSKPQSRQSVVETQEKAATPGAR